MQNSVDFGVPAADFFLMDTRLIITLDGSHTLYVPGMDEHYHSRFGAMTESEHIFINAGLNTIPQVKFQSSRSDSEQASMLF